MDGSLAIEANRAALKRIVEGLVEMAGFAEEAAPEADKRAYVSASPLTASRSLSLGLPEARPEGPKLLPLEEAEERGAASPPRSPLPRRSGERWPAKRVGEGVDFTRDVVSPDGDVQCLKAHEPRTIPRLLWCAILKILRPAESAARRLVIAAARGLVVPPPPVRKTEPKPAPIDPLLRRFGIAAMVGPGGAAAILPRSRGVRRTGEAGDSSQGTMRSMVEGAPGAPAAPRRLTLALFDPPRHLGPPRARFVPAHSAPRIFVPGVTEPARLPPRASPEDWVSVEGLTRRLAALIAALDDLPGQARRYVRLSARRLAGTRRWPIRRVCPPGGRLFRYDPAATHPKNIRAVDEILAHAHALAVYALESPDTS
ncbi:MAG: hypothetical protein MEQ84_06030 [Mesorhizobium sp.]|nr:hypothetical protein [Mesorhizobium sp.]